MINGYCMACFFTPPLQVMLEAGYLAKEPTAFRPVVYLAVLDESGGPEYHAAMAEVRFIRCKVPHYYGARFLAYTIFCWSKKISIMYLDIVSSYQVSWVQRCSVRLSPPPFPCALSTLLSHVIPPLLPPYCRS